MYLLLETKLLLIKCISTEILLEEIRTLKKSSSLFYILSEYSFEKILRL